MTADPYSVLVALAQREHDLVGERRFEELSGIAEERSALVAGLPSRAPASARPALERAAALQLATTAALRAALDETRRQMGAADRGHQAVRAYARAA